MAKFFILFSIVYSAAHIRTHVNKFSEIYLPSSFNVRCFELLWLVAVEHFLRTYHFPLRFSSSRKIDKTEDVHLGSNETLKNAGEENEK